MNKQVFASKEQTAYADILFYGCWVGLALMLITYFLYVSGMITPHIPLEDMPKYWSQPVGVYLKEGQVPTGWGWISLLSRGDFLNFLGVVLLAGLSIICYLRIIPSFLRNKDIVMFFVAALEVLVLLLAASGIVGSGAH